MRILILEDDPYRNEAFRERYPGAVIVCDAQAAIGLLLEHEWDLLFLDHDLGGETFVLSGPGTGYEVACWLQEHPGCIPPKVILHSMNPSGRSRMKQALPSAIEMPCAWQLDLGVAA
jgi:CheY-like chemotaxis protein